MLFTFEVVKDVAVVSFLVGFVCGFSVIAIAGIASTLSNKNKNKSTTKEG